MSVFQRRGELGLALVIAAVVAWDVSIACTVPGVAPPCSQAYPPCPEVTMAVASDQPVTWQLSGPLGITSVTGSLTRPLALGSYTVSGQSTTAVTFSVHSAGDTTGGVLPESFQSLSGTVDSVSTAGPCLVRYAPPVGTTVPVPFRVGFTVGTAPTVC